MTTDRAEARAGIYIHVPFCSFVCPYCDFAVERVRDGATQRYVELLLQEIDQSPEFLHTVDTIYFGGGTPSLLTTEDGHRIVDALRNRFEVVPEVVIHTEANPEDVTPEFLRGARDVGVSFLSLGVQSFEAETLRFLGRRHTHQEAVESVEMAMAGGFDTVSVDLMFGLPAQDLDVWLGDLDFLAERGVQHISCYQLNIKPDTLFEKKIQLGRMEERSDDDRGSFFASTHGRLTQLKYEAYEVSNFAASPANTSKHNRKYWDHSPYLGFGPAAHSFHDGRRFWNLRDFSAWGESLKSGLSPREDEEILSDGQLALEEIMLSLRQPSGLDLEGLKQRYGVDVRRQAADRISNLVDAGLVVLAEGYLRPTLSGLAVADSLAADVGYFL